VLSPDKMVVAADNKVAWVGVALAMMVVGEVVEVAGVVGAVVIPIKHINA
jgi:hypothetical protein